MKNPKHTAIFGGIMIALFFASAAMYQSCSKKTEKEPTTEEKAEAVAEEFTPESFFEDDAENAGKTNEEEVNYQKTESPNSSTTGSQSKSTNATGNTDRNPYLVIAGNYLIRSNADAMVNNLKKRGYNNAQVSVFDLSQYYTVIAGRYNSRARANEISANLKNLGIDNYVLRKN